MNVEGGGEKFVICRQCRVRPANRRCQGRVEREGDLEVCELPLCVFCAGKPGDEPRCEGCR